MAIVGDSIKTFSSIIKLVTIFAKAGYVEPQKCTKVGYRGLFSAVYGPHYILTDFTFF